jgi:hypothetical protein
MWHPGMHANMNSPAWLALAGIGAAFVGFIFAVVVLSIALITRHRKIARITLGFLGVCAVVYALLLFGFSLASHDEVLVHGAEKYFCEIDCHLAYSVVGVKTQPDPAGTRYLVTLRTRFDETTISTHRPKDMPLQPVPRTIHLMDAQGHRYTPESASSGPLSIPLIPGQSHLTELSFQVPAGAQALRLLIITSSGWPDTMVIGDENSWLHKKTYFAI